MSPLVLRAPIADLPSFLLTTKYEPKADSILQSLINVLSNLMNMSPRDYQEAIIHWMEDNMLENLVTEYWWKAQNQDWPYYFTVLQSNCKPDGLEIWCACVATYTHITLVQKEYLEFMCGWS